MTFLVNLVGYVIRLAFYSGLPALLLIAISWLSHSFTKQVCYDEFWMMPLLVCISVFIAGVMIRQSFRKNKFQLLLTLLGMLGFVVFTLLLKHDIQTHSLLSVYLPKPIYSEVTPFIYSLPLVGLLGMVFSNLFSPYEA